MEILCVLFFIIPVKHLEIKGIGWYDPLVDTLPQAFSDLLGKLGHDLWGSHAIREQR